MELKDLTVAQAEQILNLAFPFPENIVSEIKHHYQPYDATMYEDAAEYYYMKFNAVLFGTPKDKNSKPYTIRIWIYPNLNVHMDYNDNYHQDIIIQLGVSNQRAIQKKFTEFGFE